MYILLEIIRYTFFSNTRLLQFNSIPTLSSNHILIYSIPSLSLGDIYLHLVHTLLLLHPPSVLLWSSFGHSRSFLGVILDR